MDGIAEVDFKLLTLLTADQAHTLQVIPFKRNNGQVYFYINEKNPPDAEELSFLLGSEVKFHSVEAAVFEKYLFTYYPQKGQQQQKQRADVAESSDVIRFVDKVFQEAISIGTSDIHVERYENHARIRFRWEGQLLEKYEVGLDKYDAIVSRLKILSELDISERRLPQDGRIHLSNQGKPIDVRVSTIPGKFGEKVVMRLLTRSQEFLQLENLGMNSRHLELYKRNIHQPNGIVLITGPTGSGKTTTLYASLNLLNQPDINITTVEDPIEYNLEGINQVQVKEEIGLSFGASLRAFLRQDPDIIMIGEIRDQVTAEIAIRAALTGHLVFSTLHTNSALDAVSRLGDMGIPPYLLAASLRLVVAQRLIRVLCQPCKMPSAAVYDARIQAEYGLTEHFEPKGCPTCNFTGYQRRKAIYEMLPITDAVGELVKSGRLDKASYSLLNQEQELSSLQDEVLGLMKSGETSLKEGLRYLY